MKIIKFWRLLFFLPVVLILGPQTIAASNITGIVYDNRKNPLADVDIELLDDLSRVQSRTKTDGSGRYEFRGLSDGRFILRVLPFRFDYEQQEQSVELASVSAASTGARSQGAASASSATTIQDFYLLPKKGSVGEVEASLLFAQEIPKEARSSYDKAIDDFANKRTAAGITNLKQAIERFPDYFLALQRLGREYVLSGNFAEAVPLLAKAADVNQKSPLTFYSLGYALQKLGYHKAAVVALKQAAFLSPSSASIFFSLGTSERLEGQFTEAESHLLKARKLSQGKIPDIHWQLALLYGENLKRYAEAADELEQFLKEKPAARDALKIKQLIQKFREMAKTK